MDWKAKSTAVLGHIRGVIEINKYIAEIFQANSSNIKSHFEGSIEPSIKQIRNELEVLLKFDDLPHGAKVAITKFLQTTYALNNRTHENLLQILPLMTCCSELEYAISDTETQIRSSAECAFMHLQHLIKDDENVRDKWGAAYDKGETECENLGKLHLLWHGLYTFKIGDKSSDGAQTDFAYRDNPKDIGRAVSGIVLTEWKMVRDIKKLNDIVLGARVQLGEYKSGILAHIELKKYSLYYLGIKSIP